MIQLTDEMKAAFSTALKDMSPVLVASAGKLGMPDIAYKGSSMVFDDEHLAFWERAHGTTLQNISENGQVCLLYRNAATRLSWKFFGVAELHREGPMRDAIMSRTIEFELGRDPDRKGVGVLIRVDSVMQAGKEIMRRE